MPSVSPNFEYDIFISYRHNDNRSGWVTDFVNALQEELASTIKEPLSIYFDKNPHDGLLETHNVDKSLEGKLKCLLLIPIISQTYCDPKSFAWQHEFCAFNKLAKIDQFGRDIKLNNGNVASRILPIKIHDLDAADKAIMENELGGALRAIEFIYKTAGVVRPLKTIEEDAKANLNHTFYRDQINKAARAIKELIVSMKNSKDSQKGDANQKPPIPMQVRKKIGLAAAFVALFGLLSFTYYYFGGWRNKIDEKLDKSIAVLPFVNMSNDPEQEYFSDGLSEEIINALVQINGLKVIARTSSFQFKGKNEDLRKIGELLNVSTVLEGSVRKSADKVRVTAQLINTSDGTHLWSKTFDRSTVDIFKVQNEIALAIANEFKLATAGIQPRANQPVRNEEAYRLYQIGRNIYDRGGIENSEVARGYFERAVKLDSTFAPCWSYLSACWLNLDSIPLSNQFAQKALVIDPNEIDALVSQLYFTAYQGKLNEVDHNLQYLLSLKIEHSRLLRAGGRISCWFGRYEQGIELCRRAVEIDPLQGYAYAFLSDAYEANGQFREAEVTTRKGYEITKQPERLTRELILNKKWDEALTLIKEVKNEDQQDFLYALAYHAKNNKDKSIEYLKKCEIKFKKSRYFMARVHAFRNEPDEVFRYLELGLKEKNKFLIFNSSLTAGTGGYVILKADPFYIPYREDSRFRDLVRKLGFPN